MKKKDIIFNLILLIFATIYFAKGAFLYIVFGKDMSIFNSVVTILGILIPYVNFSNLRYK